jgi:hypothetical protein
VHVQVLLQLVVPAAATANSAPASPASKEEPKRWFSSTWLTINLSLNSAVMLHLLLDLFGYISIQCNLT